jgi:hypothetical protein
MHGVLVRRPGVASLTRRRGGLTPQTQYSEEEEPKPVRAFAQLRRLAFGLMTVSHENPSWSVPHTSAHAPNPNGTGPACERRAGLRATWREHEAAPRRRAGAPPRKCNMGPDCRAIGFVHTCRTKRFVASMI